MSFNSKPPVPIELAVHLVHLSPVEKRKRAWYDGVMKNISDEQTVFRIEKGYKRSMLYTTIIFLFISTIGLLVPVFNPLKKPGEYIVIILWETICLMFIVYSSWYYFGSRRFAVRVYPDGLRFGANETTPLVLWSDIQRLKMQRCWKRIKVVGRDKKILGRINLQLDGIASLISKILKTAPHINQVPPSIDGPLRFRGSRKALLAVCGVLVGSLILLIKFWPILGNKKYGGLIVIFGLLFWIYTFARKENEAVEFKDNILIVKTMASERHFNRKEIASVELFVPTPKRSGESLDVLIRLRNKKVIEICPKGQDPFDIYGTCRRFLASPGEIEVFAQKEE